MRPFEYVSATSTEQASRLLGASWQDAQILAGGTDLLALMKDDVVAPKRVVNVKAIPQLATITVNPQGLRIGALVKLQDFADHAEVRRQYPALAYAAEEAASPQIRNLATMGGNLCQRPRCWYFRRGLGLLAQQDGKSLVTEGDNRYHAILGNEGPAYFVSPSSIAPALIAHQAVVRISGPSGKREVPLEKFYLVPKTENDREHDLKPNEMVTEIVVPPLGGAKAAHYEIRQKETFDWPLATAAVALKMSGNTVQSARVVLGHVAPVPWVSAEAAQAITGKAIDEQTAEAAGAAAVGQAKALSGNGYKIKLAKVAVKRALLEAARGGAA